MPSMCQSEPDSVRGGNTSLSSCLWLGHLSRTPAVCVWGGCLARVLPTEGLSHLPGAAGTAEGL